MDKIKVEQFGNTQNYLELMDKVPAIFARIIVLENIVNQLIDMVNAQNSKSAAKVITPSDPLPLTGGLLGGKLETPKTSPDAPKK